MLDTIIRVKEQEVKELDLTQLDQKTFEKRSFFDALQNPNRFLGLIAEVKKASPSKGVIREDFDPVDIAKKYERGKADCLSVLTDQKFFQGSTAFLSEIKEKVKLPVLRKDFIIDKKQVYESKWIGADAILLIGEALPPKKLKELWDEAVNLELDVLVEVHSVETLERILDIFVPNILGVNNRDLTTFHTDIHHLETIQKYVPKDILLISESGISTMADLQTVYEYGAKGVLVGESLMRKKDPEQGIYELFKESVK